MWQRRQLQKPAATDVTERALGVAVVLKQATVVVCPCCHRNGVETEYGVLHKMGSEGQAFDTCMKDIPDGAPELIIWDAEGRRAYEGPASIPPERLN